MLTSASRPPNACSAASNRDRNGAVPDTSAWTATALRPVSEIWSTTSSAAALSVR